MSTPAQPVNPADDNNQQLTPEQIAEQLAAPPAAAGGEPAQLQREYVVQSATGAVFRGRTQQELSDQLLKSVDNGSVHIKDLKQQLAEANARLQQLTPPPQPPAPAQAPEPYSRERYWQRWAEDPDAAEEWRFLARYGVTIPEVIGMVRRGQQAADFADQIKPEVQASAWMATSDFPTRDPEMRQQAANAFEQVWNEFYPGDFDMTPAKLEQVHAVALHRGLYQAEPRQQNVAAPTEPQPPEPLPQLRMPTLNTGASGGTGQADVNVMTPEAIRALIDRGGR